MMWLTELYLRMFMPHEDEDEGATMVEYGLMVALIAVVAMGAVQLLGVDIAAKFQAIADKL